MKIKKFIKVPTIPNNLNIKRWYGILIDFMSPIYNDSTTATGETNFYHVIVDGSTRETTTQ